MKNKAMLLILTLFVAITLVGSAFAVTEEPDNQPPVLPELNEEWQVETVIEGETGSGSIAVDSNDNPHISYQYGNLYYGYKDDSGWHTEKVEANDGESTRDFTGSSNSIALDSSNNPHISSVEEARLYYTYKKNGQWYAETVYSFGHGHLLGCTSIVIDSNDYPHITFKDWYSTPQGSMEILYYVYKDANGWSTPEIIDTNSGLISSLKLDSNNKPHVAYYKSPGQVMYAYKNNANQWIVQNIDSGAEYVSLQLDSSNNPHISYVSGSDNSLLKYATFNGNEWNKETISEGSYAFTSIDLTSNNIPHIIYLEFNTEQKYYILKHAFQEGGVWKTENISTSGLGKTGIVIDSKNNIHVLAHGSIKYAYLASGEPGSGSNDDSSISNQSDYTVNETTNTVNAASTVSMQNTGIPIVALILAIFLVIGGIVSSKK